MKMSVISYRLQLTHLLFSGKSYELVSYEAQQPDVMVFQPSGSEIKPGMVEFNLLL